VNPEASRAAADAMRFAAPQFLWLLLAVPVGVLLFGLGARVQRRARGAWSGQLFERLASGWDGGRERLRLACFWLGWCFVVLALARPQWGGEVVMSKRQGIDLVVALDVSTSMLAEDMRPNRLAAAKRAIADLVGRMGGDRLGLVGFAGDALTLCPLTLDHGTVLLLLDSMGPTSVSTPGTNLSAALRRARETFVKKETKYKALVLVTDGESHEGDVLREAEEAAREGIIVYAIGIGSPDGQPIPERDDQGTVLGFKKDRAGRTVNSRLDEDTLRKVATATNGRYYRSTPQAVEMAGVLQELDGLEKKELEGLLATHFEERYQWPLALAALMLALEMLIPNRRREARA
jgi:Ca-activated chloride channel family protein